MAIQDLGTQPIRVEDGWVSFTPVQLRRSRSYLVYMVTTSSSPTLIYSNFMLRYSYPTPLGAVGYSTDVVDFSYDPNPQFGVISIPSIFNNDEDAIIQIRRISFYGEPSQLADVTVNVRLDPNDTL